MVNDPALASLARSLAAERWQAVDLPLRTTAEDFGFFTTGIAFMQALALKLLNEK